MWMLSPQSTQIVGRFRLRNENFACELINFACETILFRRAPRKLLKSFGREMSIFAGSCDFKGLRPILFRAVFLGRFSLARRVWAFYLVSQNSSIARIRFLRKSKGESPSLHYLRFHGVEFAGGARLIG
jgi:hypothetical protein